MDVEIRAGIDSVAADASKRIKINELCGTFKGPGVNRRVYTVMCKKEIVANYVTLQIVDTDSILQINELEIIPASKGMSTRTYTKLIFFKDYVSLLSIKLIQNCQITYFCSIKC